MIFNEAFTNQLFFPIKKRGNLYGR